MVNQLLFGDFYKVIEERAKWVRIRTFYDKYESWIDRKQWREISKPTFDNLVSQNEVFVVSDLVSVLRVNEQTLLPILFGSSLPFLQKNTFKIEQTAYTFDGNAILTKPKMGREKMVENAFLLLQAPYLWGGKSPFGIDCSGFTQLIYKLNGVKIPRDAFQQAEIGTTLSFVEEAEQGDLAFFDNEDGNIIHVGMLLNNSKIIHASGNVRIDPIDHHGIYNLDLKTYSHRLRLIKKIIK